MGEDAAVRYLQKNNFRILERNYLKPWGEIDIVAEKIGTVHFIEVKSRAHGVVSDLRGVPWETVPIQVLDESDEVNGFFPEENVTRQKQMRFGRIIDTYLLESNIEEDLEHQVDIIAIMLDFRGGKAIIRHMKDVVLQ